MKFDQKALANASGVFVGIVYLFCRFAVALFPKASLVVTRSWFHGFDMAKLWTPRAFSENMILGLITAVALSWVAGYLFAECYNYFVGKK
jgi:hypothetical protein